MESEFRTVLWIAVVAAFIVGGYFLYEKVLKTNKTDSGFGRKPGINTAYGVNGESGQVASCPLSCADEDTTAYELSGQPAASCGCRSGATLQDIVEMENELYIPQSIGPAMQSNSYMVPPDYANRRFMHVQM